MTLSSACTQYYVYLTALGLSKKRLSTYRHTIADILLFYGPQRPLAEFTDSITLEYVEENDPFDSDPVRCKRGEIFCVFVHWLMKNKMIPAWAAEMQKEEADHQHEYFGLDDFQTIDDLLF